VRSQSLVGWLSGRLDLSVRRARAQLALREWEWEDSSLFVITIGGCCVYEGTCCAHGRADVLPPESVIDLEDIRGHYQVEGVYNQL
jgi:hypothetical protein